MFCTYLCIYIHICCCMCKSSVHLYIPCDRQYSFQIGTWHLSPNSNTFAHLDGAFLTTHCGDVGHGKPNCEAWLWRYLQLWIFWSRIQTHNIFMDIYGFSYISSSFSKAMGSSRVSYVVVTSLALLHLSSFSLMSKGASMHSSWQGDLPIGDVPAAWECTVISNMKNKHKYNKNNEQPIVKYTY